MYIFSTYYIKGYLKVLISFANMATTYVCRMKRHRAKTNYCSQKKVITKNENRRKLLKQEARYDTSFAA